MSERGGAFGAALVGSWLVARGFERPPNQGFEAIILRQAGRFLLRKWIASGANLPTDPAWDWAAKSEPQTSGEPLLKCLFYGPNLVDDLWAFIGLYEGLTSLELHAQSERALHQNGEFLADASAFEALSARRQRSLQKLWEKRRAPTGRFASAPLASQSPQPAPAGAWLVSRGKAKPMGVHYTPSALAQELVGMLMERASPNLAAIQSDCPRILDPASGGGGLLLETCLRLQRLSQLAHLSLDARRSFIANNCVFGIELDPLANLVSRFAIWLYGGAKDSDFGNLEKNLVCADALLEPPPEGWEESMDGLVANPPFLGGKRIRTELGAAYRDSLKRRYPDCSSNADLSAYFVRNSLLWLKPGAKGVFVTTNSISQGPTGEAGLGWALAQGARIEQAVPRRRWPGKATVILSLFGLRKASGQADQATPSEIGPDLKPNRSQAVARRLANNGRVAYVGYYVRGRGFFFDDTDPQANPLTRRQELLAQAPAEAKRIRPYLGGAEITRHPRQAFHRYVIDLFEVTEEQLARYPKLTQILRSKARPMRQSLADIPTNRAHIKRWWRFADERRRLRKALEGQSKVWVIPRVGRFLVVAQANARWVFSEQLVVIVDPRATRFALLQSRLHEIWARPLASTFGDGLRYTPSRCFESFPFLPEALEDPELERLARRYLEVRQRYCLAKNLGLTRTYARIYGGSTKGDQVGEALAALRRAQWSMEQRALQLYGLANLCDKPWPWLPAGGQSDILNGDLQTQVLGRLFELNEAQASAGQIRKQP